MRMAGRPYRPGGILDTVAATRQASASDLTARALRLIEQALALGTTTMEVKTGYGLTAEHEATHLRIARSLTPETTFLGAHLVPPEFAADRSGYLRLLSETMIPAAAGTARWCDVFCEKGAFDVDESRAVLEAGRQHGMGLRVHANQLGPGQGVALACELGAASADHCTHLTPADVDRLAGGATVATLLPDQRLLHPAAVSRMAGPCSTPAPPWLWPATATPVPATPRRCPWPWRWPCGSAG